MELNESSSTKQKVSRFTAVFRLVDSFFEFVDRQIPENLLTDPDNIRRAKLITRFGVMGSIFGLVYASFYLFIGHLWGAEIILLCTVGVAVTPVLMRRYKSTTVPGNFFSLTLTLGFLGLCLVEGGIHGHAIAWLVSVPLCALLLLGQRAAIKWVVISLLAAALVAGFDLSGVPLPVTYDPKWEPVVSTAGYLGLILFMFGLGFIFESGRARAHARLKDAVDKLFATNERLVYLNNEKNEFLGIAAHDLRNPLTVILANAEVLKIISDPKQTQTRADMIVAAAERMRHLISNLLDVDAIEEGRFASKVEPCDLNNLVQLVVGQIAHAAAQKKIAIRVGLAEGVEVHTDQAAATQIIDNLVSNAIKYSPTNSTVYVHTLLEKNYALVRVRDEGPGISETDRKKLFQKYSRLSARPTGGESSTGLGLAIAKRLAEALAGNVECQSTLGEGATFIFRLPLGANPPVLTRPARAAGESGMSPRQKTAPLPRLQ